MKKIITKLLLIALVFVLVLPLASEARQRNYTMENSEKYKSKCFTIPEKSPLNIWFISMSHDLSHTCGAFEIYPTPVPVFVQVPERTSFMFCIKNKSDDPIVAYKFNCKIYNSLGQLTLDRNFTSELRVINPKDTLVTGWWENTSENIGQNTLDSAKTCVFKILSVVYLNGHEVNFYK